MKIVDRGLQNCFTKAQKLVVRQVSLTTANTFLQMNLYIVYRTTFYSWIGVGHKGLCDATCSHGAPSKVNSKDYKAKEPYICYAYL